MIGAFNLIAWSRVAPWSEQKQVEQDLLISRALVAIFGDPFLAGELRFRGGTALNKLHFPQALRYSEDVDLVRTSHGPIRPLLDALRAVLEPWLGKPTFEQSPVAPKLVFRAPAEDGGQLRLKVEINTRETEAFDSPLAIPFRVDNPWFSGQAQVATFSREEMLATKLRALLQRNKGRDLFDLSHALQVFEDLDTARVIDYLGRYLQHAGQRVSRAQAEERMFGKLRTDSLLADMRALLPPPAAAALTEEARREAFVSVFTRFIESLPGEPWARSAEMIARYGLPLETPAVLPHSTKGTTL